jgi:hypothetical protein
MEVEGILGEKEVDLAGNISSVDREVTIFSAPFSRPWKFGGNQYQNGQNRFGEGQGKFNNLNRGQYGKGQGQFEAIKSKEEELGREISIKPEHMFRKLHQLVQGEFLLDRTAMRMRELLSLQQ